VGLGYFAQHQMEQLGGDRTVLEELQAHAPTAGIGILRNLAGAFGFHGDDVEKPIRVLSGGEKARLVLAKLLYDAPNLLILDEPTNHLDQVTKRAVVRALAATRAPSSSCRTTAPSCARWRPACSSSRPAAAAHLRRHVRRVREHHRARGAGHAGAGVARHSQVSGMTLDESWSSPSMSRSRHVTSSSESGADSASIA
jgi:hypothetical protein